MQGNVPTTQEIEEFFAYAEQQQQQQRLFTEKYGVSISLVVGYFLLVLLSIKYGGH